MDRVIPLQGAAPHVGVDVYGDGPYRLHVPLVLVDIGHIEDVDGEQRLVVTARRPMPGPEFQAVVLCLN